MTGVIARFSFLMLFAAGHFLAVGHLLAAATAVRFMLLAGLVLGMIGRLRWRRGRGLGTGGKGQCGHDDGHFLLLKFECVAVESQSIRGGGVAISRMIP
jgi:hypothetical protein